MNPERKRIQIRRGLFCVGPASPRAGHSSEQADRHPDHARPEGHNSTPMRVIYYTCGK